MTGAPVQCGPIRLGRGEFSDRDPVKLVVFQWYRACPQINISRVARRCSQVNVPAGGGQTWKSWRSWRKPRCAICCDQPQMRTRFACFGFGLCCGLVFLGATLTAKDLPTSFELARQLNEAFVQAVEKISPSVVVIYVVQKPGTPTDEESSAESIPRQFRRYFHQFQDQPEEKSLGQASGVIIRED